MSQQNRFVLSWDQTGLESVISVNEIEHRMQQAQAVEVWNILADSPVKQNPYARELNQIMTQLIMRARANSQRHYEIYLITADADITADDIRDMFNNDPQSSADTVRQIGTKIYSDRVKSQDIKIT